MKPLKAVTLEMSLKPFHSTDQNDVEVVCRELFEAWKPLTKHAQTVCVLLWTADGSEILDYDGREDAELEWCRYIGGANPLLNLNKETDPDGVGLHTRWYLYTKNPPTFTNGFLKRLITTLKRIGTEATGKPILVGETFDPGPEFAKSDFKYNRHREICVGASMGQKSMVCCYATLNADSHAYAAYPDGIPDNTPFGTFFGKQAQRFLTDLGFDYLWLSNGFGFGTETWNVNGATFDGKTFYPEKIEETQRRILDFWRLFRSEFHLPVQTRGTNLTTGIDFATDAVNLEKIYAGDFNILAPPNSPWAAINGDFGLELAGYLSHIAKLPAYENDPDSYLFRFYLHDPWWMNSPWLDRYESQPHDIYLPLSVSRINPQGQTVTPDHLNLLTVDNSLGEMPENCVNEVIPHLLKGFETAPDAPAPFVWVYPFNEYHENASGNIAKLFFEDRFIVQAINNGLPLNTVIASDDFIRLFADSPDFLRHSVLVVPVPANSSLLNDALLRFVQNGGQIMLYGALSSADEKLLNALKIRNKSPLTGEMALETHFKGDIFRTGTYSSRLFYDGVLTDGGVTESTDGSPNLSALAVVRQNDQARVVLSHTSDPNRNGGGIVWCRGSSSANAETDQDTAPLARYFALAAEQFGYSTRFVLRSPQTPAPVITLHRNRNALWLSAYNPDTTTDIHFNTPLGAPLLTGFETILENGRSVYRLPRAAHAPCRVFVRQSVGGVLQCKERAPVSYRQRHKLEVNGLRDASIYVLPLDGDFQGLELLLNAQQPFVIGEPFTPKPVETAFGPALFAEHVTGSLQISDLFFPPESSQS
ncbi:MAG TPA: hypothetical protein PK629_09455 [Oscillospiraceae bacterium]|nr:hypothetical protein [Oscillospiraceae bacterium]HPF54962.1 hypothetical protein [Clostridiales bacterium]HPK34375.1 hypothetical protein [Oscillospiraceae bacterium]HPR75821.1 hypothetical protein [Oscillospiraceae bacterium]